MGYKIEIVSSNYSGADRKYYSNEKSYKLWLRKRVEEYRKRAKLLDFYYNLTLIGYKDVNGEWVKIDEIPIKDK